LDRWRQWRSGNDSLKVGASLPQGETT